MLYTTVAAPTRSFMRINKDNYKAIGTALRCHDSFIKKFEYDFDTHNLRIRLSASAFTNIDGISFEDVVCFRITGFEPWGHDSCVFDWQYIDPDNPKAANNDVIEQIKRNNSDILKNIVLSEFVFKSGDTICIASESVLVD